MIKLTKSTFFDEVRTKEALCLFISRAKQLSFGEQCHLFEENFSKWQGRQSAVFFNSGSSANLALMQSLLTLGRLKQGARVGISAITWATNVMPVLQLGCVPIVIDVELDTLNVSGKTLRCALEETDLDALFLTHLLGFCDELDQICDICTMKGILLLEDTCESLGTIYQGKKLGNFGLASTFSTYVGHHLSTIEGGMVCTDDEELRVMLQMVRAHGWDRNLSPHHVKAMRRTHGISSDFSAAYTFYVSGFNLRPTEINGFLGNSQLPQLDTMLNIRQENFFEFSKVVMRNEQFRALKVNHLDFVSNFAMPIICQRAEMFTRMIARMAHEGIEIRPIAGGSIVEQPFFKTWSSKNNTEMVNAGLIASHGFYFGNNAELTAEEKARITHALTAG